jgi:hypothetical protein
MVGAEETVCTRAVFGLSPTEGYEEFDKMTVHTTNCFTAGSSAQTDRTSHQTEKIFTLYISPFRVGTPRLASHVSVTSAAEKEFML